LNPSLLEPGNRKAGINKGYVVANLVIIALGMW
jgi:hypothetical protein